MLRPWHFLGAQEGEHEEELQEERESDEKQQKKVECQVGTKGQHQTGCKRWQSEEANEQCRRVAPRNNTVGEDGAAAQLQKPIKQHNKTIIHTRKLNNETPQIQKTNLHKIANKIPIQQIKFTIENQNSSRGSRKNLKDGNLHSTNTWTVASKRSGSHVVMRPSIAPARKSSSVRSPRCGGERFAVFGVKIAWTSRAYTAP